MNNLGLIAIEAISATLAFTLARFMLKPYEYTRESRYLGLPLGFASLGASYIFMGAALSFSEPFIIEQMKWLQLFTGAYAFAFLATTYYFSQKAPKRNINLLLQTLLSLLVLGLVISYLIVLVPPTFALPSYKVVDEYFRIFNMILAIYIAICTLRHHALKPDPKTILAPLGYALLAFSQYSLLIWSFDSSFSAFVGAHIIRLASLLVFFFVSYKAFITPQTADIWKRCS
jgi:hypothetical protein